MNKKIYYNDKYLEFTGSASQSAQNQPVELITSLDEEKKTLKKILKDFLNPAGNKNYLFVRQDFEAVLELLKPKFHYIEAAGGFIERNGRYLFIFRHQRWDLPKGKKERGEAIKDCAVRECEEECGVNGLQIRNQLGSTFHIYPHKGDYVLKQTFWFYMTTTFGGTLIPELDEDITQVEWFSEDDIRRKVLQNTYYTIADVVREALTS